MSWLRLPITAMLLVSLVFSDVATFWHRGNCCDDHVQTVTSAGTEQSSASSCNAGCRHQQNPFAARRAATAKAVADQQVVADAAKHDCQSHSSDEHDSDRCSICRWLVTARDVAVCWAVAPRSERSPIESSSIIDWASPALTPQFHELSRRGPPAAFFLL